MKHAGASYSGTPALRLSFIAVAEQIREAAGDIVHFSLFVGIIGLAVHVESREEVTVTCVKLSLSGHRILPLEFSHIFVFSCVCSKGIISHSRGLSVLSFRIYYWNSICRTVLLFVLLFLPS